MAAVHPRGHLDDRARPEHLREFLALLFADITVGDFTATKPHRHLYLVSIFKEAPNGTFLDVEVMVIRLGAELDLLDFHDGLVTTRFRVTLLFFILQLPEVGDLADRRAGERGDLDEVKSALTCECHCIFGQELSELSAFFVDDEDTGNSNAFIDSRFVALGNDLLLITSGGTPQKLSNFGGIKMKVVGTDRIELSTPAVSGRCSSTELRA